MGAHPQHPLQLAISMKNGKKMLSLQGGPRQRGFSPTGVYTEQGMAAAGPRNQLT